MLDKETREMIAGQLIRQGAGYQRKIMDIEAKQERPGEINAMIRRLQEEANVWAAKLEATAQAAMNMGLMQWADYMAACREAADRQGEEERERREKAHESGAYHRERNP